MVENDFSQIEQGFKDALHDDNVVKNYEQMVAIIEQTTAMASDANYFVAVPNVIDDYDF